MFSKRSILSPIQRLTRSKPNAPFILLFATVVAVIVANSPLAGLYEKVLAYPVSLNVGGFEVFAVHGEPMSLLAFANDVLMVLFFLLIGLEIKQEMLVGELSSARKALLPVVGAMGGMLFPVLFFLLICHTAPENAGAAIPMATDIAFTLAVLSTLGNRVPTSLKAFITTLAVADDIGGIIVIAVFYSTNLNLLMLLWAAVTLLVLFLIGRMGINKLWVYILGLFVTWLFFLQSGIHTTIAGVLVAFMVPTRPHTTTQTLEDYTKILLKQLPLEEQRTSGDSILLPHKQVAVINSMRHYAVEAMNPVQRLESVLSNFVSYFVLPLFAFVNAGVTFGSIPVENLLSIPLGIFLGLFLGKPLGIFLFSFAFIKLTGNHWPKRMTPKNLFAVAILGGIGFTVSLFIASLSYKGADLQLLLNEAKLGIFVGSTVSGIVGYFVLRKVLSKNASELTQE